jgi:hypothetical protein
MDHFLLSPKKLERGLQNPRSESSFIATLAFPALKNMKHLFLEPLFSLYIRAVTYVHSLVAAVI